MRGITQRPGMTGAGIEGTIWGVVKTCKSAVSTTTSMLQWVDFPVGQHSGKVLESSNLEIEGGPLYWPLLQFVSIWYGRYMGACHTIG